MEILAILLSFGVIISSDDLLVDSKPPGCTTTELAYLIRLEISDDKIYEICNKEQIIKLKANKKVKL